MMNKEFSKIYEMSVAERLSLVEEIWDSIADDSERMDLTNNQKDELDRRLRSYQENPEAGISWDNLKKRILINK